MSKAGTILIATGDGVPGRLHALFIGARGLRGELCDELSLLPAVAASEAPGCLLLDQDVFARMVEDEPVLGDLGMPVVLLVGALTRRVLDRASAAGVAKVVEKPLFGGVLLEAIWKVMGTNVRPGLGRLILQSPST